MFRELGSELSGVWVASLHTPAHQELWFECAFPSCLPPKKTHVLQAQSPNLYADNVWKQGH